LTLILPQIDADFHSFRHYAITSLKLSPLLSRRLITIFAFSHYHIIIDSCRRHSFLLFAFAAARSAARSARPAAEVAARYAMARWRRRRASSGEECSRRRAKCAKRRHW
jgi:hypothetical protein